MTKKDTSKKFSRVRIVLIYLLIGGLWIILTDVFIQGIITNVETLSLYQTYKGWFFVIITALALHILIKKHDEELKVIQRESDISNELLQKLFDRIPAMITIYNPKLDNFSVNKAFEKNLGYTKQDAKEIDLLKRTYPDSSKREEVIDFMSNPGPEWREFTITAKDGRKVVSSWSNIRLSDDTQIGIGLDMTEIVEKEKKLSQSKKLLERTINSLKESVILVEPETRIIQDCNQSTVDLFGYSREELIGNRTEILHVDEESFQKFEEIGINDLENKNYFQTQYQLTKKSGDVFYSDHTVSFVKNGDGDRQVAVSVIRDISDQKKYEQELKTSIEEKEILLQEIHHRVKNNLALVVSFLWLQKEKVKNEYLNHIFHDNILRIKSIALIHELLYESDRLSEIDIKTYFSDLIEATRNTINARENVNIKLVCDRFYLNVNQVLPSALIVNELVTNSFKHAFSESEVNDPAILIEVSQLDEKVSISVKDNGIGIPENFGVEHHSIGYNLIHSLLKQLDADFKIRKEEGTSVSFSFGKKEIKGAASGMI